MKLASGKECTTMVWDWKRAPELEGLREALTPLGVFVYEDPMWAGSDAYSLAANMLGRTVNSVRVRRSRLKCEGTD